MGVVTAVALYRVGRVLTGSSTLAAAGVALALADPAYHTFANLFFYEFMLYALLVLLVATAVRYPEHGETPGYSWWPSCSRRSRRRARSSTSSGRSVRASRFSGERARLVRLEPANAGVRTHAEDGDSVDPGRRWARPEVLVGGHRTPSPCCRRSAPASRPRPPSESGPRGSSEALKGGGRDPPDTRGLRSAPGKRGFAARFETAISSTQRGRFGAPETCRPETGRRFR
jgi:hypothetical protein